MKKLTSLSLFLIILFTVVSCKKLDIVSDYKSLGVGSYVTLEKATKLTLNGLDIANSSVSFDVKEVGSPVDKIKIYVAESATQDKSLWKFVKDVTYSGVTTINVTGTQIATALGRAIDDFDPGEFLYVYPELITKSGATYSFANTLAGYEALSAYNMAMKVELAVTCPVDFSAFDNQDWEVIEDGWEDFSPRIDPNPNYPSGVPGDAITIIKGPGANQITLVDVYPTAVEHKDVVVNVDPQTGLCNIPRIVFGAYSSTGTRYAVEGRGFAITCKGRLIFKNLHFTDKDGGDQGNANFILEKF
ncbi:MAG: hypothetical protein ACM3H8_03455 [Sphingobacteriales bacterium]